MAELSNRWSRNPISYLVIPAIRAQPFLDHLINREASQNWPEAVIFDLEDSVPEQRKDEARRMLGETLDEMAETLGSRVRMLVKINSAPTRYYADDLAFVGRRTDRRIGIALAKTETVQDLDDCLAICGSPPKVPVLPAVETVAGFYERDALFAHCAAHGLDRFAFGAGDMSSDLGVERDYGLDVMKHIVMSLVISCRRYGIGLVDSPCRAIPKTATGASWDEQVREECRWNVANGVKGKIAIHPAQIPIIHAAFGSAERTAWARGVLADFEKMPERRSVVSSANGEYMGTPTLKWARRVLDEQ